MNDYNPLLTIPAGHATQQMALSAALYLHKWTGQRQRVWRQGRYSWRTEPTDRPAPHRPDTA